MAESVTLRYDGAINGIGWGTAGGIFGGFSSLDNKSNYQTQRVTYRPDEYTLDDGTTVTGRFEVVVHVETDTKKLPAAKDELATDIYGMGLPGLAGSREEAKQDMETDLFSIPIGKIESGLENRGVSATRDEIRSVVDGIDQHQIKKNILSDLSYERWDRSSPINGTPANEMIARDEVPDNGPIYIVRGASGNIIYFQYVDPINGGPLEESSWEGVAQQHLSQMAEQRAGKEVVSEVMGGI